MKIPCEKPDECSAVVIGQMVPAESGKFTESGRVHIICGDRNFSFETSDRQTRGLLFENDVAAREQIAELASEIMVGFCVKCPNNPHTRINNLP